MPNPLPLISSEVDASFRFEFECEDELVFCLAVSASILSRIGNVPMTIGISI